MNEFYGGGWEPRANTGRANATPASYRAEGLKPNAPTASTHSPTSPAYSPRLVPAVTGQGDYTPEELVMREAYWREQMADAAPTTDRHFNEYGRA